MNKALTTVVSSQIAAIGHDGKTLTIQFNKGGVYEYANVTPEDYAALMAAESVGSHFSKKFKNNAAYPCTKVG